MEKVIPSSSTPGNTSSSTSNNSTKTPVSSGHFEDRYVIDEAAWDEPEYIEAKDKTALKRVNNLLKDLQRNGANCSLGKSELLKGNY